MMVTSNKIEKTSLAGLLKIERPLRYDERGYFHEVIRPEEMTPFVDREFVLRQVNHSRSVKGVLRALHAERWDKIVWVARGKAYSAIVDVRPDSPTFGKFEEFELNDQNGLALFIPEGFANSICALEDTDYVYFVNKIYDGSDTFAVTWDDPDIAVPWPIANPIISERDRHNPRLRDLYPQHF